MRSSVLVVVLLALGGCGVYRVNRAALVPHMTPTLHSGNPLDGSGELSFGASSVTHLGDPKASDGTAGVEVPGTQLEGNARVRLGENVSLGFIFADDFALDSGLAEDAQCRLVGAAQIGILRFSDEEMVQELLSCTEPVGARSDAVCCFFLLHAVPTYARHRIVANLLEAFEPGGRIVFVDYHQPRWWHPMGPAMALVFRYLEPFANSLLAEEIATMLPQAADFEWTKETCFGGLYQKVVGTRRS